jgi:hypothetical protein
LIESQFDLQADYALGLALDYFTEVSETLLPPHEPNEKFFRLMIATLTHMRTKGDFWTGVMYFTLWAVRLTGVMPEIAGERRNRPRSRKKCS